jgi:hypothetical protein
MTEQRKSKAPREFEEAPDVGGPGQAHAEQTFGRQAEAQSRSDLRDERGGATDAAGAPPEGLKRERKDPLSPTRGRAGGD